MTQVTMYLGKHGLPGCKGAKGELGDRGYYPYYYVKKVYIGGNQTQ